MVEKRRFFSAAGREGSVHVGEELQSSQTAKLSQQNTAEESLFVHDDDLEDPEQLERGSTATEQELEIHASLEVANLPLEVSSASTTMENGEANLSQIGYELFQSQLVSVLGEIPAKAVKHLYLKFFNRPNYILLASNEYFNGIVYEEDIEVIDEETPDPEKEARGEEITQLMERIRDQTRHEAEAKQAISWKRFIGTLDVEAWATRPYMRPLKYKQELDLKRLIPNKIKKSSIVAAKFGDSAIIRLYTMGEGGREIGRLPEDITRILSPLIDLELADFEATVIMDTKSRLSIGDPFYLQIRCYLNNNTFENHGLVVGREDNESQAKKRKTVKGPSFNFSQETEGEAALRLKQKSISRLFERLCVLPFNKSDKPTEESITIDDEGSEPTKSSTTPEPPADELSLDQLKEFYMANQHSDFLENLPETTEPPQENFKLTLRPYQKHGLSWMLAREKELDVLEMLSTSHGEVLSTQKKTAIRDLDKGVVNPLWSVFKWPSDGTEQEEDFFYGNMYNGELSREKPMVKNFLKGGVLADEMGLGKTISTLSLIHSVPYDNEVLDAEPPRYASKSTLIVVPMSLLSQWKSEFDRSNNNPNHKCFVYYGDLAQGDLAQLLCGKSRNIPMVVLTTYGTVQNEWARLNKVREENGKLPRIGLFSVQYLRIVLDEGHTIRNRTTKTAKSVHELDLTRRWILTGTPVVNRLDDIFSLVKFLRLDPWSNFSYWKTFVTLPFEQKKFNQTLDVVKSILQPVFLRRTKNMKQKDGTPLVDLPEKEVVIEELEFSKRELLFYNFFKSRAYQSFKDGMKSGDLLKKYTQILTHILRLRQVCCHPDLVTSSNELDESWDEQLAEFEKPVETERFTNDTAMKQVMYSLYKRVNIAESECSICTQAPISVGEMAVTECGHSYCFHCLIEHFEFQAQNSHDPLCPDCRAPISRYRLFKVRRKDTSKKEVRFHTKENIDDPSSSYDFQLYHYDPDKTSTKIEALIVHLRALKEQSPGELVVVFSQFSSYLDLMENELKSIGNGYEDFVVYKFDGRLSMTEREKILQQFTAEKKPDDKISILLLSLKAGGVGLNLTCANRAYMMDPWWSPAVEDQAIDRIHRIGQAQNVKVVRFIVKNSIEQKMLRIQERKRMMGEAVEVEEEERRKQRIEEIKLLFDE